MRGLDERLDVFHHDAARLPLAALGIILVKPVDWSNQYTGQPSMTTSHTGLTFEFWPSLALVVACRGAKGPETAVLRVKENENV